MSELTEDLAAFLPASARTIRFQGRDYPVRAFLDLTIPEALDILRDEANPAMTMAQRRAARLREIALLIPTMDAATRGRLTPRQAVEVMAAARDASAAAGERPGPVRLGFWFAQVARFYGWGWAEIRALTVRQLQRFLAYAPELQARERLEESLVAAFPHLEASARRDVHQRWLEAAGLLQEAEPRRNRIPWSQIRAFIGAKGHA